MMRRAIFAFLCS